MTTDFDELARIAWVQLWQVTIVALVVGTVVRLCCRDRPSLAYALWMLVVVKSIVPPVWSSPTGLFSWALASSAVAPSATGNSVGILRVPPTTTPLGQDPTSVAYGLEGGSSGERGMDWAYLHRTIFSIWATGLALCTTFVLGNQILCSKLIRKSSRPVDGLYVRALAELAGRLNVSRRVRLIVTSRPIGPAVFGLFRPSILLPEPLLSGTPLEQVKLVLAHELIHVRRGDVFAGKLQLVAQLIWWFNPLIWWANREVCRERERCCDEEVVSGIGCKPAIYARTLLSILEQKGRLRSLVAIPGVRALEVTSLRLESIMRYTKNDHRRASSLSRLVFATGLVLFVPGTGLTLRAHPAANDNPNVVIADVAQETTTTGVGADSGPIGQSELSRAEDRLDWAERMFQKGYVSKAQLDREREKVQQ
jgi:bla regulator protein blaR1